MLNTLAVLSWDTPIVPLTPPMIYLPVSLFDKSKSPFIDFVSFVMK